MGEVAVLHRSAFLLELLYHRGHVDRIPDDHGIGHQIETQGLMAQGLPPPLAELALVRQDQRGPQVM